MKKLAYALLGLAALVLLVLGGAVWYLRSAEADPAADAVVPGLKAEVQVWRDSLSVPHVWAKDEADLFRAVGYVHAQDRLWQMELFRRAADGRLSEVLGAQTVDSDRFLRTVGMGRAAAATEATLSASERALLQAYADGVNAWISGHRGALPPEFVVLRFRPEPWTVRNSLAIGKIMAWDLSTWSTGLDLQRAVDLVGPELARDVHPTYPAWGVNILGTDATWKGKGAAVPAPGPAPRPVSGVPLPRVPQLALDLLDAASITHASNSWVVGGERTASGKPILANDMHLTLRAPSLWYLGALHGGGLNVAGMMLPGVPLVVAGHSDRVAWGYTNAMVDDADLFVEEVDPQDSTRYRVPGGWAALEMRPETIRVKDSAPMVHRVRVTRHGPVLSDVDERAGRMVALRWTAQDPSTEVAALLAMNRARDAAEFTRALRTFNNPHQNVVFADAEGAFGYWMAGRVPVRRSGDGLLPVRGWTGEGDWVRYLDFDEHPHVLNPAEGFLVTANNRQLGPEYPHRISSEFFPPYRAMRIRELVQAARDLTADDVARQQMDVRDLSAVRYLPHAVSAAAAAGERDAAALLRGWNGDARADSRAAALYYTWFDALRVKVGRDEYRGKKMYFPRAALEAALDSGGGRWVDDVSTPRRETLPELAAAAMREAVSTVGGRTWGQIHPTLIEHSMGSVNALDRALNLNVGPFPNGGSGNTVNVAGFGAVEPPFTNKYGPSQRHVVDMGDPDGAGGFVIPTGQSGLPFSRHYRDQTPLWRTGRLWRIPLDRAKAEARTVSRMRLRGR